VRTLATKGTQLENLADLINETASKSEYSPRTEDVQQAHSVFIGNLPSFLDEAGIKAHLKGFPGIDDARFNIGITVELPLDMDLSTFVVQRTQTRWFDSCRKTGL